MKTNLRQRLLATTLLVGASALATPAFAQDQNVDPAQQPPSGAVEGQPTPSVAATGEPVEQTSDIIVTGSRIPQPNLESAAPVTVVSNQDVKLSGTTRVEDLLNQLPSVGASQASGVSNGATGTAEVDLRYLGSKRSLALVNGRRMTPGDPNGTSQAADLNLIPASLIKRVEVLTGGASSVYGADAVAGVVNFIMDTSFTGIRFDGQYSTYQHKQHNPFVDTCFNAQASAGCAAAGDAQHMSDILAGRGFPRPTGSVWDGEAWDGTVSLGAAFDDGRGHAVAYFGYRKVDPVLQGDRDFSACVLQMGARGSKPNFLPRNSRCGGSATANPGNAFIFTVFNTTTSTTAALGPGTITTGAGANLYNFAPLNYFQRPDERYIAGAFADYEISPALKPYLEFMFMDDRTLAQIAPSGDFFNTTYLNCNNPLLSAQQLDVICGGFTGETPNAADLYPNLIVGNVGGFPVAAGAPYNTTDTDPSLGITTPQVFIDPTTGGTYYRALFQLGRRNVEGGPRIADLKHESYRGVLGLKGDLSNVWSYDGSFQYGRTNYTLVYKNEFSASRLVKALDVIDDPRTAAVDPICRSVLDGTDPNCVPYDVFGPAGPSAASINYLNVFGVIQGQTSEQIANLNFTGSLGEMGIKTPWSDDGVGVNLGAEYRKESLDLNPDQSFQTGDLTGQGAPTLPVSGNFRALEVFGEAQVPIIRDSFINELSVGLGYRKSFYKLSSGRKYDTDTYKISAEFAPISDIRFRGSYNRAVRAPNIQELFAPQFVGLDGSLDPCAGRPITATDYGCLATTGGSPSAGPSNPAGQYNGLLGGNPNLNPEKATTKTVGVVLQPRFIPRLAVTVDYWNIKVDDAIQGFGADAIINACINQSTATFTSPACDLVQRAPGSNSLWLGSSGFIIDTPNNEGTVKTDGWDINASYSHGLGGVGMLGLSFIGTYLHKYEVDNGLTEKYDCAGFYGPICSGSVVASSAPMPKWRHKARVTLSDAFGVADLGISLQWRRVGKVTAETLQDNETLGGDFPVNPGLHIGARNYFDLATTFTLFNRANFRLGVNNLFDKDPPLVTGGSGVLNGSNLCPAGPCNGNTYPGTWDALGRYLYAGVTIDFKPSKAPPPVAPVIAPPPPPPPPPPPATQTCADGSVILATEACPAPPPPPPPPPPAPERG